MYQANKRQQQRQPQIEAATTYTTCTETKEEKRTKRPRRQVTVIEDHGAQPAKTRRGHTHVEFSPQPPTTYPPHPRGERRLCVNPEHTKTTPTLCWLQEGGRQSVHYHTCHQISPAADQEEKIKKGPTTQKITVRVFSLKCGLVIFSKRNVDDTYHMNTKQEFGKTRKKQLRIHLHPYKYVYVCACANEQVLRC